MTIRLEKQDWTYEDYCELPEDGNRYEIIDGRLYMTSAPRTLHQILSRRIQYRLYELELANQGFVFNAPCDLVMPGCTPVQPDLIFLDAGQVSQIKEKYLEGVPTLLVEILSPKSASHDRVTKLNRYASSGVPYYWIVDGASQSFEVLELVEGHYRIAHSLTLGDAFDFRGIRFEMDSLFAPVPGLGQLPDT